MNNFEIKNQNGRSMIEMLGVLAIIGVLSVGGIAGYSKAMMKYRINKTIEQITLIAGNVRAFFAPQGNYDGLNCFCEENSCHVSCKIMRKAKLFPDEMLTLDADNNITAIKNIFDGDFEIYGGGYGDAFWFRLFNLPEEACIELSTQDWNIINAKYISDNDGISYNIPIDINTAANICYEGANIGFHLRK